MATAPYPDDPNKPKNPSLLGQLSTPMGGQTAQPITASMSSPSSSPFPAAPGQYGGINPSANPTAASTDPYAAFKAVGSTPTAAPGTSSLPPAPGTYGGINPSANPTAPAPATKPGVPPPPDTSPVQPGPDQAGIGQFQSWAQTTFGREATPQELQQIANSIGYTGGPITPAQMTAAKAEAEKIARAQGWTGGTPTAEPPPSTTGPGTGLEPGTDPNRQTVNDTLKRLIEEGAGPVDPNAPQMVAQRDAFRRGQGRALEQAKRAAAERGASGGTLGAGGFDAGMTTMDLEAAGREGDFEAGLVTRELEGQRDRMMQGLQLAQASGQADQARALQERIANLNAQIQSRGQDIQGRLGQGDIDLRRLLGLGQLNLGYLNSGRQNDQFYSGLGAQMGMGNAQLNQQALLALLQG